jgi:hypothetical protein
MPVKIFSAGADASSVGRRFAIVGSLWLIAGALWMSRLVDWPTLYLRTVNRVMTAKWIPIHLRDGRTLRLDLQDDEMLENVQPEPFPDGHAGSVARWFQQVRSMSKEDGPKWPVWLVPYPGAEQAPDSPYSNQWATLSSTERRGVISRAYRTADPPERVIEHYREELEHEGIRVTGQTREPAGISGFIGESDDQLRSVTFEIRSGEYSVTYLVTEHGQVTPLPDPPALDLTLASVDEAGQFVRLRNRVDGEILRLPFNCLPPEDEFEKMREVRAAKRPDFLPPYPGSTEILPAAEDPNDLNFDFQVKREPPARIADFYKKRLERAGFKLESEDSGMEAGLPYAGFRALAADGGRVVFGASQSGEETEAHALYIKRR